MAGRLGVDFGTSKTVIALWDDTRGDASSVSVPRYSQAVAIGKAGRVSLVPSLIHYAPDGRCWVGAQVHSKQLYDSPQTFRWMKRDIVKRRGGRQHVAGQELSPEDAGRSFMSAILAAAGEGKNWREAELAFTLPIDGYEDYREWLAGAAESAGLAPPRFIDAASAAVLGSGVEMNDGEVYLAFDFGGSSLGISIILIEDYQGEPPDESPGRRFHVLGKAGAQLGGITIDQWLFEDVLARNGQAHDGEEARQLGRRLLVDCEKCKETLTFKEQADISVLNAETGTVLSADYTRDSFRQLLESHGLFTRIEQTLARALEEAATHGCQPEHITAVLMVGGSSLIPAVRRKVIEIFGKERVRLERPFDASARGAAAFAAGAELIDFLQHDYAIRHLNPTTGQHDYRPIVRRGTVYPTAEPVAKVVIKASHDNQASLGLALFEISSNGTAGDETSSAGDTAFELNFDPTGAVEFTQLASEQLADRTRLWLNEHHATFLAANPPGTPGEPRFEVQFDIDADRRLLVTAQDLKTGQIVLEAHPVIRLQ